MKKPPNNPILKWAKEFEKTFLQRHINGQMAHTKVLNITNNQGNANYNHDAIPPYSHKNGHNQKIKT